MEKAWLMIAKGDDRQHAGNLGYDDRPSSMYSWDNTVANYNTPEPGDGIVIWDGKMLLGASVIAAINYGEASKTRLRCPNCRKTNIKERRKKLPKYRCHRQDCRYTFNEPLEDLIQVKTYQTDHEAGWIDLSGHLEARELRNLCYQNKSQQSLRPFDWRKFLASIGSVERHNLDQASVSTDSYLSGGHKIAMTRVRTGQAAFRKQLLKTYGSQCAFTGLAPEQSLDAAHLYSYATVGRHHDGGGLLLRKDLHRLFDLGLIAINPSSLCLDLAPQISNYNQYANLQDTELAVKLTKNQKQWVQVHWENHRN